MAVPGASGAAQTWPAAQIEVDQNAVWVGQTSVDHQNGVAGGRIDVGG